MDKNLEKILTKEAKQALKQIRDKSYKALLQKHEVKKAKFIGVAFFGKHLVMTSADYSG